MMVVDSNFPGAEMVERALADLRRHEQSSVAIALQVIAPRLRLMGHEVPTLELDEPAEIALYQQLANEDILDPYSSYNAILRRLRSFAAAVEAKYYRERRQQAGN